MLCYGGYSDLASRYSDLLCLIQIDGINLNFLNLYCFFLSNIRHKNISNGLPSEIGPNIPNIPYIFNLSLSNFICR